MSSKEETELMDTCFPVPQGFSLNSNTPVTLNLNERMKRYLFQKTIQTAYKINIPSSFYSDTYRPTDPYSLVSEEQIETVASLFQAVQPQDAIEAALVQQFIIVHLQALESAKSGICERAIKKFELTHQILDVLQKYRSKGAQQIQVNYNHNQGQINNIKVIEKEDSTEPIEAK